MTARRAPDVTIGPLAAPADEVSSLVTSVIEDTYPAVLVDPVAARTVGGGRIERLLSERTWFQATLDGWLVAVAAVHLSESDTAYLSCHFVALRGVGVGSELTRLRLDWARSAGATRAVATTHPWNQPSLANLARFGFTVSDRGPDLWVGHGELLTLTARL
jgi:GNAT superfamily N-acetyltransferase